MALLGSKIPINPQAAALAKKYVAEIRKLCGWSHATTELPQNSQEITKELPKHFQETDREWELEPEDIEALEKIPF